MYEMVYEIVVRRESRDRQGTAKIYTLMVLRVLIRSAFTRLVQVNLQQRPPLESLIFFKIHKIFRHYRVLYI